MGIWTSFVSSCLFLASIKKYYVVSSVSFSAATRLAYDTYLDTYRTYADVTFFSEVPAYDLFQLLCVLSTMFLLVFLLR